MTKGRTRVSKPKPCDFIPLAGSEVFPYEPGNKTMYCKDSDLAWIYASKWENKDYTGELKAVDLNNVACAYLWLGKPDWEQAYKQAYKLFVAASEKSQRKNKTIESNKRKAEKMVNKEKAALPAKKIKSGRIKVPTGIPGLSVFKVGVPVERAKRTGSVSVPAGRALKKSLKKDLPHRLKRRK